MTITDCPTFIDLGALATAGSLAAGAEPFGADARMLPVRAGPCEVYATRLAAGEGTAVEDRGDNWIFALDGDLRVGANGQAITLALGTSAVIARGTRFAWRAAEAVTIIGMRYLDAVERGPALHLIDNGAPMKPSSPPLDEVLTSERPECRSNNVFRSENGEFQCGTWDSTPYQRIPIFFRHSELMHLLEGEVTFTDEAGRTVTFRKDDTYIIEQGAKVSWTSHVHVAKIYAQYKPPA